jgi:Skp family chaperone for outer membrane proteins
MAKKKEQVKATEEESVPEIPMDEEAERKAQQAAYEDYMKERTEARAKCGEEVNEILEKYGCEMTAQMLINEHRVVPQVFIIDKKNRAER